MKLTVKHTPKYVQKISFLLLFAFILSLNTCGDSASVSSHNSIELSSTPQCPEIKRWEYGGIKDSDRKTSDISPHFNLPSGSISFDSVPLHGIVRYPNGRGPFPLVVILHGNHKPTTPSYTGYNYLLDYLAKRCMIVVSIDEEFLNGNVSGEIEARAIVLLRHLQLWRKWNQTPGHQFHNKVNMSKIGLAGHSRGGEAIVLAQKFDTTFHEPSDPIVGRSSYNFNFKIKALFGLAPTDNQNRDHTDKIINNADYYIMHGTHDGDVYNFEGQRTYNRAFPVTNSAAHFKGLLWVYGANHNYWNTHWGADYLSVSSSSALISAINQRKIAQVYMSAFFEASLKNDAISRKVLSGETAAIGIPASIKKVFQYQGPERLFINHFEEDSSISTTSISGGSNSRSGTIPNFVLYSFDDQGSPHHLWGQTDGLITGWGNRNSRIEISLAPGQGGNQIPDYNFLAFHVGQTYELNPNLNNPVSNQDFSVQLEFNGTLGPEVKVSDYQKLIYPLQTTISAIAQNQNITKSVQQTVRIPFSALKRSASSRMRDVTKISLKFNQRDSGNIAIDEIQFTN